MVVQEYELNFNNSSRALVLLWVEIKKKNLSVGNPDKVNAIAEFAQRLNKLSITN